MLNRFTERGQKVVVLAQLEAQQLHHPAVGTEHLLIGILKEGEGIAAKALESLGINLPAASSEVEKMIGTGEGSPAEIGFTPRAKKVFELANEEAGAQGVNYIATEHILLGLIREGEGLAARILVSSGASLDIVRERVIDLLGGHVSYTAETEEDIPENFLNSIGSGLGPLGKAAVAPQRQGAIRYANIG